MCGAIRYPISVYIASRTYVYCTTSKEPFIFVYTVTQSTPLSDRHRITSLEESATTPSFLFAAHVCTFVATIVRVERASSTSISHDSCPSVSRLTAEGFNKRSELFVSSSRCLTMLETALNGEVPGAVFQSAAGAQLGQSSPLRTPAARTYSRRSSDEKGARWDMTS